MSRSAASVDDVVFDWRPWRPMNLNASYYSVHRVGDGFELWFDARIDDDGTNGVVGLAGPRLDGLEREPARFDASLVEGYTAHQPARRSPIISRTAATRLRSGGYIVLTNIGPEYAGGASELYPALFVSATGRRGDWRHIGAPAGEPRQWLDAARRAGRKIRCEGGRIFELPDGRLRMYIQGFGVRLAVAEAASVDGPWRFRRDDDGRIVDVLSGLGRGWLFPHVMRIGRHGYVVTGADRWPPTGVDVAFSVDGLHFAQLPGDAGRAAPLITPSEVVEGAASMKALRGAYDERTGLWHVVANVWDRERKTYLLYSSACRFPVEVFRRLLPGDDAQRAGEEAASDAGASSDDRAD